MSPKRTKTGAPKQIAGGARIPKTDATAVASPGAGDDKVTFSFHYADRGYDGAWKWLSPDEAHHLLEFMCDIGSSTWNEIKTHTTGGRNGHKKHHDMEIRLLCKAAQDQITKLHLDEVFGDQIFRFRLGNKRRLWGFIAAGVFYVLWWDATHEVYPLDKD
jgi:hypothetical protein